MPIGFPAHTRFKHGRFTIKAWKVYDYLWMLYDCYQQRHNMETIYSFHICSTLQIAP